VTQSHGGDDDDTGSILVTSKE